MSRTKEKEMERMHLLSTIVNYPDRSTQEIRDIANDECQHDSFDPLPHISPRGITGKLNGLSLAGLIDGWQDGGEMRWRPTDNGAQAWAEYQHGLEMAALEQRHKAEMVALQGTERGGDGR